MTGGALLVVALWLVWAALRVTPNRPKLGRRPRVATDEWRRAREAR